MHISESINGNQMKLDTLREEEHCARPKTLSQVAMQLLLCLIFPVTDFSGDYLRNEMELNET